MIPWWGSSVEVAFQDVKEAHIEDVLITIQNREELYLDFSFLPNSLNTNLVLLRLLKVVGRKLKLIAASVP